LKFPAKFGSNGGHLKFGITNNPGTRYTREELGAVAFELSPVVIEQICLGWRGVCMRHSPWAGRASTVLYPETGGGGIEASTVPVTMGGF